MSNLIKGHELPAGDDSALLKAVLLGQSPQGDALPQTRRQMRELGERNKMLGPLIAETRQALDAKLHHVALQSALTLPDICGSVEYPESKDNIAERYIRWCESHLECCSDRPGRENGVPNVSGEVIYNLRNNLLHAGCAKVDRSKFKRDETNVLDHLILIVGSYEGVQVAAAVDIPNRPSVKTIITTVEALVHDICDAAEKSYAGHRDEFDCQLSPILDFSKVDWLH